MIYVAATVRHVVWRQHELFATVRERFVVPSQLDDLHRLFEDLAVDAVVLAAHSVVAASDHGAECPGFARHGAAADTELHAAAGDDVG